METQKIIKIKEAKFIAMVELQSKNLAIGTRGIIKFINGQHGSAIKQGNTIILNNYMYIPMENVAWYTLVQE